MDRQPGAYIAKDDGTLEPDLRDEAMAARQAREKDAAQNQTEVTSHAIIE